MLGEDGEDELRDGIEPGIPFGRALLLLQEPVRLLGRYALSLLSGGRRVRPALGSRHGIPRNSEASSTKNGAGDGIRTHDGRLGRAAPLPLSYSRRSVEWTCALRIHYSRAWMRSVEGELRRLATAHMVRQAHHERGGGGGGWRFSMNAAPSLSGCPRTRA